MLDTCVLDVLLPGLIDAVAGTDATPTLKELARSSVFLDPLPHGACRYNPLFRALLRAHAAYKSPDRYVEAHRRAARWYEVPGAPERPPAHLATVAATNEGAALPAHPSITGHMAPEKVVSGIDRGLPT